MGHKQPLTLRCCAYYLVNTASFNPKLIMSLNATMLTEHKYWGSKQCIWTIWMHHEASSESGSTNHRMQFRPIEFQLALNWFAGYNQLYEIAGSPYFDSYMYSQKLPFLCSSFHHDVFFMHSWDWTLAEIRYRLFIIYHELHTFRIWGWKELAGQRLRCWAEISIKILCLRALLMKIGSYNPF